MEDLQKHLDDFMREQNNRMMPDFEGYSPNEMQHILYNTFELNSPLQLQKLTDTEYKQIPIFNQIKYLAELIFIELFFVNLKKNISMKKQSNNSTAGFHNRS